MQALGVVGHWLPVHDGDDRARALYLRHYSAEKSRGRAAGPTLPAQRSFGGNGQRMVLLTLTHDAAWCWRRVRGEGIVCSLFRNEGPVLSSELIREADELAWARWADEPRHFTFVNPQKVRSANPGACFKHAGWRRCGTTKGGLIVLERVRDDPH